MASDGQRRRRVLLALAIAAGLIGTWLLAGCVPVRLSSWARATWQDTTFGCGLRRRPLVRLMGTGRVEVSWELTCPAANDKQRLAWACGGISHHVAAAAIRHTRVGPRRHLYSAMLYDLPAGEPIEYSLQQSGAPAGSFTLASGALRVAIVGDNQKGPAVFSRICGRICACKPDMLLHVGDMVQTAASLRGWQVQFFDPLGHHSALAAQCPLLLAQGNHDVHARGAYRSPYLRSPDDSAVHYHALTTGLARWLVLDSNDESAAQVDWLRSELASPATRAARYVLVVCHVGPFIEFWDPAAWARGESTWARWVGTELVPLFEQFRVDAVFSGHQHNFQLGRHNGVTYITSGGAGGSLDKQRVADHGLMSRTVLEHHYQLLDIAPEGITGAVYSQHDRLLARYTISSRAAER